MACSEGCAAGADLKDSSLLHYFLEPFIMSLEDFAILWQMLIALKKTNVTLKCVSLLYSWECVIADL